MKSLSFGMNISVSARRSLIALAAIGATTLPFGTLAADESLNNWIAQSRVLVDKHMSYPIMVIPGDQTGESYVRVTIDENGHILKYEITGKSGSGILDRASLRTVKKINQFPAIPASHLGDEMTFGVKLRYDIAYSAADYRKKTRKAKVKMEEYQTASNSPMSAEIVILAAGN